MQSRQQDDLATINGLRIVAMGLLAAAVIFFHDAALAADDCTDPQTQTDMNICAGEDAKEADKNLTQIYEKALAQLADNPAQKQKFEKAQAVWAEYRDLNCQYASDVYEGGSMAPLEYATCFERLTLERAAEIPRSFPEWP